MIGIRRSQVLNIEPYRLLNKTICFLTAFFHILITNVFIPQQKNYLKLFSKIFYRIWMHLIQNWFKI